MEIFELLLGVVDMFETNNPKVGCFFIILVILIIVAVIYFLPAGTLT